MYTLMSFIKYGLNNGYLKDIHTNEIKYDKMFHVKHYYEYKYVS